MELEKLVTGSLEEVLGIPREVWRQYHLGLCHEVKRKLSKGDLSLDGYLIKIRRSEVKLDEVPGCGVVEVAIYTQSILIYELDKKKLRNMQRSVLKEAEAEGEEAYKAQVEDWLTNVPISGLKLPQDAAESIVSEGMALILRGQANEFNSILEEYQQKIVDAAQSIMVTSLNSLKRDQYWSMYKDVLAAKP